MVAASNFGTGQEPLPDGHSALREFGRLGDHDGLFVQFRLAGRAVAKYRENEIRRSFGMSTHHFENLGKWNTG